MHPAAFPDEKRGARWRSLRTNRPRFAPEDALRGHFPLNFRRLLTQQPNQLPRIGHGNEAIARKQLDENQQGTS